MSALEAVLLMGARPNFVKASALTHAADERQDIRLVLVHTGQHYDAAMSTDLLRQLEIRDPDAYLGVGSASHAVQTARVMDALDAYLDEHPTDELIVVGDVNSTMAGALVGAKRAIRVSHVEAGLRSGDRSMPEEINRIVTDAISDRCFTPSPDADENLRREGVPPERIHLVGNVMVDTMLRFLPQAKALDVARSLGIDGDYGYVTLHRPSNVDDADVLAEICSLLAAVSRSLPLVFAAHPRTVASLERFRLTDAMGDHVTMLPPVGYFESISLQADARIVLTDSGGVQEETTVLGVPCLTMRDSTERPITVEQGTNRIVGNDRSTVLAAVGDVLASEPDAKPAPDLWDGRSARRVLDVIVEGSMVAGS